ncbi:hypothetical protein [Streptomyces sp. NPDC006552]|uniref:hypothetical protein n=1 Tax=Streptomyces sp. NPDC006552 TaxID=3157179 RepID=UPI00339EE94F
MNVEIQPDLHRIAAQLGADVPYALKALAGQLADDPDLGRPSGLPGILTVTVDGTMLDDCPDLSVGYIREPDRIEIRYLTARAAAEPSRDAPEQKPARDETPPTPTPPWRTNSASVSPSNSMCCGCRPRATTDVMAGVPSGLRASRAAEAATSAGGPAIATPPPWPRGTGPA